MFEVRSYNPELRRKGRVLAVMLSVMMAAVCVLAIFDLVYGDTQSSVTNGAVISSIIGLYVLNLFGFVRVAGLGIVAFSAVTPFLLIEEGLAATYLAMSIPVLIASFLLVPWSGFVVSALMAVGAAVFGIASPVLLLLFIIATVSYLYAESLDRTYRENRYRELHDELTGLPNRVLFTDRLQKAIERSHKDGTLSAILFMDLDRFKVVNDSLGHESGNELLVGVAQRLQSCLRPGDTVARFGADEFAVLLDGIWSVHDAVGVAERITETLEVPFELTGQRVFIGTSVGIALIEDGDGKPDPLRSADIAMYQAKKEGKARCKVFNPDMHFQALNRLELENDLRRAIEQEELKVYYQPKVLLSTGEITGMEALVRWGHPRRGLVLPEEFIPLAEKTGLIVPLGRWVLWEASHQAREWRKRYPTASPLVVSVNLSVRQFQEPNLVEELAGILRETGLAPLCLQLEITESVVADDFDYAVGVLQKLKGRGIQFSIDDFGTGYSSLASLRRFPMDALKIDKTFVEGLGRNAHDEAIAQLVIDLAHAMGMQAVAEGVETAEQLAQLWGMGCDQAQGYYFWGPIDSEAATALLADSYRYHLTGRSRNLGTFLEGGRYSGPG